MIEGTEEGNDVCLVSALGRNLSLPLEPKLAPFLFGEVRSWLHPCGRRCPHWRPALTGSFDNC